MRIFKLKKWEQILPTLENPRSRPNDFQRLVLSCIQRGMNKLEAQRVFGVSDTTLRKWTSDYAGVATEEDLAYFMRRARELGADDEVIAEWFGFDRPDKVAMLLAPSEGL